MFIIKILITNIKYYVKIEYLIYLRFNYIEMMQ